MKRILSYMKPYRRSMTFSLTIKVAATLLELALPYMLGYVIDDIITPLGQNEAHLRDGVTAIIVASAAMIVCAVLAMCGNIYANRLAAKRAKDVAEALRSDLFRRTLDLSASQSDDFTVASLESRLTSDTYNIHNFINTMQRMGIRAPIFLFGGIAVTATLDLGLTLVTLAVLPFIFVTVTYINKKGLPLFKKSQASLDDAVRVAREDFGGIRVIKALSKEKHESERFDRANRALAENETVTNSVMSSTQPAMSLFMNVGLTAVVLVGAFRVDSGLCEPGKIVSFIQYFTLISTAMMSITRVIVIYSKAAASSARIDEVLSAAEDLPVERNIPKKREKGIVFDNVSFSYGGANVLRNVSFSVNTGEKIGVIGATGSGKTTLLSLLMRFYDPSEGSVRIDGCDLRSVNASELHAKFGAAMQNDFIFAGTIAENVDFGRGLSRKEIENAARISQADEYISKFEDGYEHRIAAMGADLSGGQKQRLLVARAVAAHPEILLLDDSSSALDYATDAAMRRALAAELPEATVITVAQRVSSIRSCDRIIVLDRGEIVGNGTHAELMKNCAIYRETAIVQNGGDTVGN